MLKVDLHRNRVCPFTAVIGDRRKFYKRTESYFSTYYGRETHLRFLCKSIFRMGRSPLNISRSYRECGKTENVNHFLLHCPLYEKLRITMLDKLQSILTNCNVKLSLDVHTRNR